VAADEKAHRFEASGLSAKRAPIEHTYQVLATGEICL